MAMADLTTISTAKGVAVTAVAEIDEGRRKGLKSRFPKANLYADWREMLDKEAENIDCVNVSTPDHLHAAMVMSSMQRKTHGQNL